MMDGLRDETARGRAKGSERRPRGGWREVGGSRIARLDDSEPGSDRSAGEGPEWLFTGCPGFTEPAALSASGRSLRPIQGSLVAATAADHATASELQLNETRLCQL